MDLQDYMVNDLLSNNLYVFGQVALDMLVTVPCNIYYFKFTTRACPNHIPCFLAGAGRLDLGLEAVPDFDVTLFSMRICRVDIYKVSSH